MSLYSSLEPYPEPCQNSILNVSCASIMADACAVSNQSGRSKLLDGASNCSYWKSAMEEYHDIEPATVVNLVRFLDLAITRYCNSAFGGNGLFSPECQCLNMPVFAKEACAAQTCGGDPQECLGQHFSRYNNGMTTCINDTCTTYSGKYVDIQFPQCIPQVCWNQQCWNPDSLLLTAQRDDQKACSSGVCISIIGTDTITTPAADPSSFQPSSFIAQCGNGPVDGFPIYVPTSWNLPVDNTAIIPASIANGGNQGSLVLRFLTTTNYNNLDIGIRVPDEISIASNGRTVFNIEIDQELLFLAWRGATNLDQTADVAVKDLPQCWVSGSKAVPCSIPSNTLVAPRFYYEYYTRGIQKIFTFSIDLVLNPPVGAQQRSPKTPIVINKQIPKGINVFFFISLSFLVLTWLFYVVATRRAAIVLAELQTNAS